MATPCEKYVTAGSLRARFLRLASTDRDAAARGIWSLCGASLAILEESDGAAAAVLVPSEHVLLLAVDLPLASHRRRLEALPFAIEDRLAEPLEAAHVALGRPSGPNQYLTGVVRHEMMREWLAVLEAAGLGRAALVPDALALPMPPPGGWSVDLTRARAVVRTDDGAGFAVPEAQLSVAWAAAGRPPCTSFGDPLPSDLSGDPTADGDESALEPLARRLVPPALDLRQGLYARRRAALSPLRRRVAIVAASGLLAHGAIAAAETVALRSIATQREAETRSLLAIAAPGRPVGEDVVTAAAEILPAGSAAPGRFFPLLARASAALEGAGAVSRSLSFDADEGSLTLDVEAANPAALRNAASALAAAGFASKSSESGAAGGAARAVIIVRQVSR